MPVAWDESLDTPAVYDGVAAFNGGQVSYAKARTLGPAQSALLQDCEIAVTGQISTRFGTAQIGGTVGGSVAKVFALGFYNSPSLTYELAICNGNLYRNNGGTWTLISALTVNDTPSIVQGNNTIYVAAGADIFSWDGTTFTNISTDTFTSGTLKVGHTYQITTFNAGDDFTNVGGVNAANTVFTASGTTPTNWTHASVLTDLSSAPRNASILLWHTNRLIAGGPLIKSFSTDPVPVSDALYFSDFLDAATWGVSKDSEQLRVGAGDGLPIIAAVPWTGFNIAVFKRRSVYVVEADPTVPVANMSIRLVHGTVGCIARRSAVQVGSDVLFLADDGIRSLQQVVGSDQQHELSVPISHPVQDIINRVNWPAAGSASAVFWNSLYIIALPLDGSSTNNYILVFNTITKSWQGLWTNLPVQSFAVRELSGTSRLMLGLSTANKVIEYLDYTNPANWTNATFTDYNSTAVQPRIKTRAFLLADALAIKLGFGGEIEWNNSSGSLVITPVLDEVPLPSFSINIPSGGFVPPITPPFFIAANGLSRKLFDLMQYGEWRELQFDIVGSGAGRKELRQIAIAGIVRPTLVGGS